MESSRLQYIIWGLCLVIILQAGWAVFRLSQLKQRKIEAIKLQEQRLKGQEDQAKEELKSVPEPEIKEKLAVGGRLWIEPEKGDFSKEFELEIWMESEKEISKVDLRIFYPSELVEVIDEDWTINKNGLALWSSSGRPDPGSGRSGRMLVKTISFRILEGASFAKTTEAKVEFDFNKESLMDCNLLDEEGNDVLESVENGIYLSGGGEQAEVDMNF